MFKDKIIAAIKAKFANVNLSKKRLDAIAAKIEAKVIDDETKIDAALDAFNEYNPLAEMAKQDDALRNLEAQVKAAAPAKAKDKTEPVKVEEPVVEDGTPAWAKALIEQNKILSQGLATLQGEKVASSMRSKAIEKLKAVPVNYWGKRPIPEKDEDLEAFITEVETDYQAFTKDLTEQGLSVLQTPKSGTGGVAGGKAESKEISPEVKAYVAQQKVQAEQAKAAKATV